MSWRYLFVVKKLPLFASERRVFECSIFSFFCDASFNDLYFECIPEGEQNECKVCELFNGKADLSVALAINSIS